MTPRRRPLAEALLASLVLSACSQSSPTEPAPRAPQPAAPTPALIGWRLVAPDDTSSWLLLRLAPDTAWSHGRLSTQDARLQIVHTADGVLVLSDTPRRELALQWSPSGTTPAGTPPRGGPAHWAVLARVDAQGQEQRTSTWALQRSE